MAADGKDAEMKRKLLEAFLITLFYCLLILWAVSQIPVKP